MIRAKRRRPLLAAKAPSAQDDVEHEEITAAEDLDRDDDVEEFINERHSQMKKAYDLQEFDDDDDDDENEQDVREVNVLDLDPSDSDDSDSDLLDEEDDEEMNDDEEKDDRGGSRKNWYGGDTHEYEIMEDDEREELLLDEEEEAIRLQKKALRRARLEDYGQDEDDESGEEAGGDDKDEEDEALPAKLSKSGNVHELELLADDFRKSLDQLSHLQDKILKNEADRITHQLLSLFITNVALYFSLRTDPDATGADLRSHPVLHRIVQIRSLLQKAKTLPVKELTTKNAVDAIGEVQVQVTNKDWEMNPADDEGAEHPRSGKTAQPEIGNVQEYDRENIEHAENSVEKLGTIANGVETHVPPEASKFQRQRTEKRKKKPGRSKASSTIAADEDRVTSLLQAGKRLSAAEEDFSREKKRKKLNKIVGEMERERKNDENKRMVSADLDHIREEIQKAKPRTEHIGEAEHEGLVDDEEVMRKLLEKREKKESRKARKAAESKPHVYTFNDEIHSDGKRKASSQVVKNRGLTRYRPREKKTPRTRNRLSYQKAVVRRKGAVREYDGAGQANYGGEASGINMSARKSSML